MGSIERLKYKDDYPFDLSYEIHGIDNLGSWHLNTRHKARFIKEMLSKHNCPVVFVDSDATVEKYPILFKDLKCDIAAHYRESHKTILSGTLYLDSNERVHRMLDEWVHLNSINSVLEQKNLETAINNGKNYGLTWYNLPPQYVQIFDTMKDCGGQPFISHWQASRKYRKNLNGNISQA